jgi:cytochrome c
MVGAQHGADTTRPPGTRPQIVAPAAHVSTAPTALLQQYNCLSCHDLTRKIVGPAFAAVAQKYAARDDRVEYLAGKIASGGSGVWGLIPMPAQTLPASQARQIASWLASGAAP